MAINPADCEPGRWYSVQSKLSGMRSCGYRAAGGWYLAGWNRGFALGDDEITVLSELVPAVFDPSDPAHLERLADQLEAVCIPKGWSHWQSLSAEDLRAFATSLREGAARDVQREKEIRAVSRVFADECGTDIEAIDRETAVRAIDALDAVRAEGEV